MQKNKLQVLFPADTPSVGGATVQTFQTYIGDLKEFDITVRCSSSSGCAYDIDTSPVDEELMYVSATNGAFAAGTCATLRHEFRNNNANWLRMTFSATAVVSGSNIGIYLSSVERL